MTRSALGFLLLLIGGGCSAPEQGQLPADKELTAAPGFSVTPRQSSNVPGNLALLPGRSAPGDGIVPPDEAFRVDTIALDASTLGVRFAIAECCYLYRDKIDFTLSALDGAPLGDGTRLGSIDLPRGEVVMDEFFGQTEVYREGVDVRLPLRGAPAGSDFAVDVTYQGCAEKGISLCYEPITRRFPVHSDGAQLTVGAPSVIHR